VGKANGDLRNVAELMRAENDREDEAKYNRFLITPDAFMRGEKAAREKGLDIIGFYHSHPDAPARPSKYDLDHAWPWYSYVIVSIKAGEADVMTSWVLREDRGAFGEEDIIELS
jgi:proteasome lid subunit RPN8/RPN11